MKTIILFLALAFNFDINAQVDLKVYGQEILDNKVKPTEDKETFQIIDSLLCENKADKKFYFKVFNKIQQISDGALSEHVSTIAGQYFFINNIEFIKMSNNMTSVSIYKWLDHVAFAIYIDSQNDKKNLPNIKVRINSLEKKFPDNSADRIRCKKFNDYLYKKTVDLMKAS